MRTRARSPAGSAKRRAKPRVTGFVLSEMFGLLPPIENRAVTGTVLAKIGAFDRLAASGVGVNVPVTQTPFAPLARTLGWLPPTANWPSTMAWGSASWARADAARRQMIAAAQPWTMVLDVIGFLFMDGLGSPCTQAGPYRRQGGDQRPCLRRLKDVMVQRRLKPPPPPPAPPPPAAARGLRGRDRRGRR
jgi:hypothetical protein